MGKAMDDILTNIIIKEMDTKDIIMTFAVLLGPVAAVQIQKWLEKRRENRERKLDIFKTLMTTRITKVSIEHVQALNMIDIEFIDKGYEKVINAWRAYHDHLSNDDPKSGTWVDRNDDLFIDLLYEMGTSLKYKFDKVMLKRTAYTPVAHGDIDYEQQAIRKGLAEILSGNSAFPIFIANDYQEQIEKTEQPEPKK